MRSVTRELDTREYEVSIVGGYDDENRTSEDITETLLSVMQVRFITMMRMMTIMILQALNARFRLVIACIGTVNTIVKNGVAWPRVYGAGVSLDTGDTDQDDLDHDDNDNNYRPGVLRTILLSRTRH